MADVTFDQFFSAIAGQESGGNYNARNSRTGALGKYQILPSNIRPWSQKYLGHAITPEQFASSPQLQEQLAHAVLQGYYTSYGARGAAAAWYSGSPSRANNYHRSRPNEPSVGEYVDSVLRRAGAAPASGGSRGSTGRAGTPSTGTLPSFTGAGTTVSKALVDWSKLPQTVVDKTVKNSPLPVDPTEAGQDVFSNMAATLAAGNQAPGIEIGTANPTFDPIATAAQKQATKALSSSSGPLGDVADESTFYSANGINATGVRASILGLARQYLGTPYKWGGSAPGGFDCSGLIQYVLKQNGITIPRVSYQQAQAGARTDISKLKPGDLVAWDNSSRNNGADHIAFYLGNGQILEAPKPGAAVRTRTLGANEHAWGVAMNY